MSKTLEERFSLFCNSKNLEINQNQIITVQILEDFYNKNFHSSIFNFFKKDNHKKGFYLHGGVGVGKPARPDYPYNPASQNYRHKIGIYSSIVLAAVAMMYGMAVMFGE